MASNLSFVIVFVSADIVLLPVSKGHLQHPQRLVARTTQSVPLIRRYPDLIPGAKRPDLISNLYGSAVVDHDPQLRPTGMRLQTQPLPRQDRHQTHRTIPVIRILLERTPGPADESYFRFLRRY